MWKRSPKNCYFIDRYSLRGLFCLGGSLQNHRRVFWLAGGSLKVQSHRGHQNFEFSPYAQGKAGQVILLNSAKHYNAKNIYNFFAKIKITSFWQRNMRPNFCTYSIAIKISLMYYLGISTPTNPSRYQEAYDNCILENPGTIGSGIYH